MANMSYCRFQNTLEDLRDCYDAMYDISGLSDEERTAFEEMVNLCKEIANDFSDEED